MPHISPHLSKSRFLAGRQCLRRLWLGWHQPEPRSESPAGSVFGMGHEVGEHAHALFPHGVLVEEGPREFLAAVRRTHDLLRESAVSAIFEAAFESDDVWVRADILERNPDQSWSINEVKSSTGIKPEHIEDLAVQTYIAERCGVKIARANLIHVNTKYVRSTTGIDWSSYFHVEDVTTEVRAAISQIPAHIRAMHEVLKQTHAPERPPSSHCFKPFDCEFWHRCTANKPIDWIWFLPRLKPSQLEDLRTRGIEAISLLPSDYPLSAAQKRVAEAYRTGDFILQPGLEPILKEAPGETMYLDFETFNPALPLYPGTRPYQRLPVQWSLHSESLDGSLRHREFLAELRTDPRRAFAESLLAASDGQCPVMVYSGFESAVLRELQKELPDLQDHLGALIRRMVDLLPIVRNHVDHPGFRGSYSIKDVAPILDPDVNYKSLGVLSDGGTASSALYRLASGQLSAGETKEGLREALLKYCALDTVAMVKTRHALLKLVSRAQSSSDVIASQEP